jgi:hypothetical protein
LLRLDNPVTQSVRQLAAFDLARRRDRARKQMTDPSSVAVEQGPFRIFLAASKSDK